MGAEVGSGQVQDRLAAASRYLGAVSGARTWGEFGNGLESAIKELAALVDEIDEVHEPEDALPWVGETLGHEGVHARAGEAVA